MVFIRTPFRRQSNQQKLVLIQINTILVLIQTCINTKMVFLQTPFRRQSNQQQLVLIQINTILVLIHTCISTKWTNSLNIIFGFYIRLTPFL